MTCFSLLLISLLLSLFCCLSLHFFLFCYLYILAYYVILRKILKLTSIACHYCRSLFNSFVFYLLDVLSQSRILELTSFSLLSLLLSLCLLWVHSFHSLCCLEAGFSLLLEEESILQLYKLFLVLWIDASLSIHIYISVQSCQDEWCGCVLRAVPCPGEYVLTSCVLTICSPPCVTATQD